MTSLYHQDFYAWLLQNIALLKQENWTQIDRMYLLEELEEMGANQQNALSSRLRILLVHLLKWQYQVELRSRSWNATIYEQRSQIEELLDRSPSLKHYLLEKIPKGYRQAVKLAAKETGLNEAIFPTECPYTLEQILGEEYYPEA